MEDWSKAISEIAGQWLAYAWFLLLASWGGIVSYLSRVRRGKTPFSLIELIGECAISGFAGLLTAYICAANEFNFFLTAFLVGVAGHMGGRGIAMMEQAASNKIETLLGIQNRRSTDRQP